MGGRSFIITSGAFRGTLLYWCIKSIYNGFTIAIHCTFKVVPFGFCIVQVMLFSQSAFGYFTRTDKKSRIRETLNLSTDADRSTDTTVGWTKNTQKPKKN